MHPISDKPRICHYHHASPNLNDDWAYHVKSASHGVCEIWVCVLHLE